ncbi:MAG: lactate racemase domain-containing protein [Ktedonobacteraceae bacterium]
MRIDPYQDHPNLLSAVPLPELVLLRQRFARPRVQGIAAEVSAVLESREASEKIAPGARIAIAVGSRGIANIALIVQTLVAALKRRGARPFIVPAMGSHGGATPEGQIEVLSSLGVTQEYVGAPIISSLDVDPLGSLPSGLPVYIDRAAHNADGIIVVNRIKPHTDFGAPIESGLAKMVAIGLGKHKGALTIHSWGLNGLTVQIPEAAQLIVQRAAILFGLAIIENPYDEVAEIVLVPPQGIGTETERSLTERAKTYMPRLPWDQLDVLVIDEMGKNISGAGMDPNIIGRIRWGEQKSTAADITSIAVLDLTDASHGNAIGMGMADFASKTFLAKVDLQATYINCLTAGVIALTSPKIPMIMETERDTVAAAIRSSGRPNLKQIRLARIQNTLRLEYILASKATLEHIRAGSDVEIIGDIGAFSVEGDQTLTPFEQVLMRVQ